MGGRFRNKLNSILYLNNTNSSLSNIPKPPPPSTTIQPTVAHSVSSPPPTMSSLTPSSVPSKRSVPSSYPPTKKIRSDLPPELGKCIRDDSKLLDELGWEGFVAYKRGKGDIGELNFKHPVCRLLKLLKSRGAPAKMKNANWTQGRLKRAMKRGPHKSCFEYLDFLQEEFV